MERHIKLKNNIAGNYKSLLITAVGNAPNGEKVAQMRVTTKLLDKIEVAEDVLILEPEDYQQVLAHIAVMDWVLTDARTGAKMEMPQSHRKAIIQFEDDIKAAPEVDENAEVEDSGDEEDAEKEDGDEEDTAT